jgi:hypothetical protein
MAPGGKSGLFSAVKPYLRHCEIQVGLIFLRAFAAADMLLAVSFPFATGHDTISSDSGDDNPYYSAVSLCAHI